MIYQTINLEDLWHFVLSVCVLCFCFRAYWFKCPVVHKVSPKKVQKTLKTLRNPHGPTVPSTGVMIDNKDCEKALSAARFASPICKRDLSCFF